MIQMKEQDKNPEEDLSEVEIANLLKKEFKVMIVKMIKELKRMGFPGGAVVENPPANAGDTGSCPGPGGSHMPRSN